MKVMTLRAQARAIFPVPARPQSAARTAHQAARFFGPGHRARRSAMRGFTLIEIMVVVAIIAILGATVVPLIMDRPNQARVVRAKNDIATLEGALELYKLDNFNYPSTEQGLRALVEKPSGDPEPANWKPGGYIKQLPKDPWARDYLYISPGEGGDYDIVSLGNDGAEGGTDFDSDISNWTQ